MELNSVEVKLNIIILLTQCAMFAMMVSSNGWSSLLCGSSLSVMTCQLSASLMTMS